MTVPLGDGDIARAVRAHELTHVAITPRDRITKDAITYGADIVNLCEDARVHHHLSRMPGMEHLPNEAQKIISDEEVAQIARSAPPALLAATAAAGIGTRLPQRLRDAAAAQRLYDRMDIVTVGADAAERIIGARYDTTPPYERTLDLARILLDLFGDPREQEQPDENDDDHQEQPDDDDEPNMPLRAGLDAAPPYGPLWAEMKVETRRLVRSLPARMRGRRRIRPDLAGRRLRHVGRLYTDGRVFANRPPVRGGGAVLIDTSGSMSLTVEEIVALMAAFPAGIIATYSSERDSETAGHLWIVARNGRRAADSDLIPPGINNGCDGPALQWLEQQPGPRYWISDGEVTGPHSRTLAHIAECAATCRRAHIARVENAREVIEREGGGDRR